MLVRRMRDENGRIFMRRATLLDHVDYFIFRHPVLAFLIVVGLAAADLFLFWRIVW